MFNNNDKKYIIKRVIVFLIISFISYFMFSGCVKAGTYSAEFQYKDLPLNSNSLNGTTFIGGIAFAGTGQGELIFSALIRTSQGTNQGLKQAWVNVGDSSTNLVQLQCDIGNNIAYTDSSVMLTIYTIKCPANLVGSGGIYSVGFQGYQSVLGQLQLSDRATFITSPDSSASIISSQQASASATIQSIAEQGQYDRVNADNNATRIITNINNASTQAHQDSQSINNSLNSNDSDDTSANCGVICKLKSIVNFLKPSNLIHLVVPSEQDWQSVFDNAVNTMMNKLGVIGLVVNLFTNFFSVLIGAVQPDYCMSWNAINVPNFEDFAIVPSGTFCIDTYFQEGILKTFHDTCYMIVGGLIALAFINYCIKAYKRLLDVPITSEDEYEYISTSTGYDKVMPDGSYFHTNTKHSFRKRVE